MAHDEVMETTSTIHSLVGSIFDPVVLVVAVIVTLALLSGGAARMVDHFGR